MDSELGATVRNLPRARIGDIPFEPSAGCFPRRVPAVRGGQAFRDGLPGQTCGARFTHRFAQRLRVCVFSGTIIEPGKSPLEPPNYVLRRFQRLPAPNQLSRDHGLLPQCATVPPQIGWFRELPASRHGPDRGRRYVPPPGDSRESRGDLCSSDVPRWWLRTTHFVGSGCHDQTCLSCARNGLRNASPDRFGLPSAADRDDTMIPDRTTANSRWEGASP